jgi:phospho-N-acetylmuramoyl-pentapeptide-transferase
MSYALTLATISFLLAVVWGRPLIRFLKKRDIGKQIRIEGPSSHQVKIGTPTMGGLMILVPVFLITAALNIINLLGFNMIGRSILVPLAAIVGFGILGIVDDLICVRNPKGTGLLGRFKLIWQTIFAVVISFALYFVLDLHIVGIPFMAEYVDLGLLYPPIAIFIIVGSSNAVNFTDGLDGLAGSIAAISFAAYGIIAHLQGQIYLVRFCFTVVGAILAFLWYNAYPAELFMGDTGSLALGATLAVVALMTGQWLLLPIIGFVFVAETLSIIIQVCYFKLTKRRYGKGRRIFKMAPLHHHFELLGWSETQVTQRFLLISMLFAMLGVALALI